MKKMKLKRSKKGEVIEYVVDTPKKSAKNKNEPKLKDNFTVNLDDTQVEALSNSDRVTNDVALGSSSLCENIDSKTEESNSSSQDLFKSNSFITKNRGELAEDPTSLNSAVENVKVKRSSSIKNFLSRRPLSEVFEKLDKNDESHDQKSKPHRSSSLKKRFSFGKRRRSSKLSNSNIAQERISKSQDTLSSSQIMVSNTEMDDWRMDGLLINTVEKSHSVQSLSLPSPHQNVQEEKNSNPQVVLIEEAEKNYETPTCKQNEESCVEENFQENESFKLFMKLEDSLVVTIQNLNIVVNEKHIDMPNNVPCDDWLILEICV